MSSNLDSDYSAVEHGTAKLSLSNYPKLIMVFSDPGSFALSETAGDEEVSFQLNIIDFLCFKHRSKTETKGSKSNASHAG